jgi:hypothetical protein
MSERKRLIVFLFPFQSKTLVSEHHAFSNLPRLEMRAKCAESAAS